MSEPGYSEWCPACDWNVRPKTGNEWRREVAKPSALRTASVERLYRSLIVELPKRPTAGASGVALRVLAASVLLWQLLLIAAAIFVVVESSVIAFSLIFAIPLLAAGVFPFWLVLRRTKGREQCRRSEFPELWAHVERVAAAVGGAKIVRISVDGSFNASVHRGLRGSEVTIGLPLWSALPDAQRTAVLAHELAHVNNGDPARGFVVGVSLTALTEWYQLLRSTRGGFAALMTAALAWPVGGVMSVMAKLSALTSQRAEYYADLSAADAVSTETLVAALAGVHSGHATASMAIQRAPRDGNPWDGVRRRFAELPDAERRRRIRAAELDLDPDPDGSHPPMGYRIAVLRAHPRSGDASLTSAPIREDPAFADVRAALTERLRRGGSTRRRGRRR